MRQFVNLSALIATTFLLLACEPAKYKTSLEILFEDYWAYTLEKNPLFATRVGEHKYNDQLGDASIEAFAEEKVALQEFLKRAKAIPVKRLSDDGKENLELFVYRLENSIRSLESQFYLMPLDAMGGYHTHFAELASFVPLQTEKDYENYLARLQAFPKWSAQHIALMKKGLELGITPSAQTLNNFEKGFDSLIFDDSKQSSLYKPFENIPDSFSEETRKKLLADGEGVIQFSVMPAYRKLKKFWIEEYRPKVRNTVSIADLPGGKEMYLSRVKYYTTLEKTPKEIHELGLQEVQRIKVEMMKIIETLRFQGGFTAFLRHLRGSSQFYAKTPEELMSRVATALKAMDGKLPELFGKLPRTPYGIKEMPDFIAPKSPTAYYHQPAGDGSRAGFYYVNTYKLESRPLYEVEALSFHEAVPGHHLQIALQQELKGEVPMFKRFTGATAFTEGWALYAESLGKEVGLYQDPYSDFGRLTYEMWRACRLVVDTGLHAFGWTRQQAIDFMRTNTALSGHNIIAEVDRYISWPGQALAYKMGQLKILELRKKAEAELGDSFDLREFHDTVLARGAVLLPVLERNIEKYIQSKRGSSIRMSSTAQSL